MLMSAWSAGGAAIRTMIGRTSRNAAGVVGVERGILCRSQKARSALGIDCRRGDELHAPERWRSTARTWASAMPPVPTRRAR
jgi:hypothetical protein